MTNARDIRTSLGLSRPQLAALLGVSPATLRHIETGERRATEPVRRLLMLLAHPVYGSRVMSQLEEEVDRLIEVDGIG